MYFNISKDLQWEICDKTSIKYILFLQNITDSVTRHKTALFILNQKTYSSFFNLNRVFSLGNLTEEEKTTILDSTDTYITYDYCKDIIGANNCTHYQKYFDIMMKRILLNKKFCFDIIFNHNYVHYNMMHDKIIVLRGFELLMNKYLKQICDVHYDYFYNSPMTMRQLLNFHILCGKYFNEDYYHKLFTALAEYMSLFHCDFIENDNSATAYWIKKWYYTIFTHSNISEKWKVKFDGLFSLLSIYQESR